MAFQTSSRVLYTTHYNIIIIICIGTTVPRRRHDDDNNNRTFIRTGHEAADISRRFPYFIREMVSSPPPPGPGSCPTGRPANDIRREPAARSVNNAYNIGPISFQLRRDGRVLKFMNILYCAAHLRRGVRYNIIMPEKKNIIIIRTRRRRVPVSISCVHQIPATRLRVVSSPTVQYVYIIIIRPRLNVCLCKYIIGATMGTPV